MFQKGVSGNPNGRPRGKVNNQAIREAYKNLIENNLDNITIWLEQTAKKEPAKALDFLVKLSPFVIPKLQKTDLTSDSKPFNVILPGGVIDKKDEDEDDE